MFQLNNKKYLYWLIKQYLSRKINGWEFADFYHESYNLEINLDDLTSKEYTLFSQLSNITARFSPFPEDHKNYPGVYYTEEDLRKKILEIRDALNKEFNNILHNAS